MNKIAAAITATASVGGALAAGGRNGPQHLRTAVWYGGLRKPGFTPPGPAIGAAWTVLGGLLSYTGYRLLRAPRAPARNRAVGWWTLTTLGIMAYPWSFFGRKRLAESTLIAGGMLASATALAVDAAAVDKPASRAAWPLVAWVGFAFLLSEEIARRNR